MPNVGLCLAAELRWTGQAGKHTKHDASPHPTILWQSGYQGELKQGTRQGDEEMTEDEDGESELMELLSTPNAQQVKGKVSMRRQSGIPKNATMLVSTEP